MKIHAIQTGSVRIKTAQAEGRGRGLRRRLAVLNDRQWTQWLPTYAWVIEHSKGVIVVDTGQGVHLLESSRSLHPYHRWEVIFRVEHEEEVGPQLRALGRRHKPDPTECEPRDRCRPFFIGVLGDRYGSVPEISASDLKAS
jgi:hypothetical protein